MLRRYTAIPCLLLMLTTASASGQLVEDFEDGELEKDPPWVGDLQYWAVTDVGASRRLESRGPSRGDTLTLATGSYGPFGTWHFRYGYSGGALSNFNQVRVFLWADSVAPDTGYYLVIGSNDRTVKLYDATGTSRVLLAAAADDLLDADSAQTDVRIERDYSGLWRVWADSELIIERTATHSDTANPGLLRLWIKHSTTRGSDHWFDDITMTPAVESDRSGPLMDSIAVRGSRTLWIHLSEPVTTVSACRPGAFYLNEDQAWTAIPACSNVPFADTLTMAFSSSLPAGINLLTMTAVRDPSGNVTALQSMAFEVEDVGRPPAAGDLVINEIHYAPESTGSEFVELLNLSTSRLDLTDVWISDDREATRVSPEERHSVAPGSYVVLTRDASALRSRFSDADAIEIPGWPSLNNTGDAVSVRLAGGTIDSVFYTAAMGGLAGSLERVDPASPSDLDGNWSSSTDPRGATPGGRNSVYDPDTAGPELVYVEQTSGVAVRAVFSEVIPVEAVDASSFSLDGDRPTLVAPGSPRYAADFFMTFDSEVSGELSARDIIDPAGNTTASARAPVHRLPEAGRLVINEILFEPHIDEFDGLPDQTEYIEVWNLAPHPVSLNACVLARPPDENGTTESLPIQATLSGIDSSDYGVVIDHRPNVWPVAMFGGMAPEAIRPLESGSLTLRNQGSRLTLVCADETVDAITWNPAWHHPDVRESRGLSLERISPHAASGDPRSWTSSLDPSGGAPGRANSVLLPAEPRERSLSADPSPFSPDGDGYEDHAAIAFRLHTDRGTVRVTIFDSAGRAVRHLSRGHLSSRSGSVIWDGRDDRGTLVPTGIYVVFLDASDGSTGRVETHRTVVVVARGFN